MNQELNPAEQREHLLRKLNQVFKDGYRPARGSESYDVKLKNGLYTYEGVNCLGHIFNLRNKQFDDYDFGPYHMYGRFTNPYFGIGKSIEFEDKTKDIMFDFIKEVGLKIEECDPSKPIEDFKSWKIALYFLNTKYHKDFHYLLEDSPKNWSSKLGYQPHVERIQKETPPLQYHNLIEEYPETYNLYGTYKITNENADENNRYVKNHTI